MKIAFVVSNLTYPPREGLHQQTVLTAQMQINRGDNLDLFGFCRNLAELDLIRMEAETGLVFAMPPIPSRFPDVFQGLGLRLLPRWSRSKEIRELESRLDRDYDIIHLENAGACGLVRKERVRKTLLALIDPGSLRWRRMAASSSSLRQWLAGILKCVLHSILERSIFGHGGHVQVVSPVDATYLESIYPAIQASSIPVVLPDEYLRCGQRTRAAGTSLCAVVSIDLRQPHLRSSFFWFIQCVFRPLIASPSPLRLLVLGRVDPDAELVALCFGLDVVFRRWVPDFRSVLCESDILIVPDLTGTGLKNRVLQGMALGLPVVGTAVAFEGIPAIDGTHAFVASDADKMKADLIALCTDPHLGHKIGARAHKFVMDRFSMDAVMRRWAELYAEMASCADDQRHGGSSLERH